jgi:hypothetical protein
MEVNVKICVFWNVTTCMSGRILPKVGSIMTSSSLLSYNMTMEAAEYSDTSTNFYKTTRLYMQCDKKLKRHYAGRSQWPCGLRRGSTAARILGLWVRIPPRAWMSVCCECCVLSGRGLCDGLVTRPEESYRLWCVWVWSWSLEKWGGLDPQGAVEPLEKKNIHALLHGLCQRLFYYS